MAIQLPFVDQATGLSRTAYALVSRIVFDFMSMNGRIEYFVYASEQACIDKRTPLGFLTLDLPSQPSEEQGGNPMPTLTELVTQNFAVWSALKETIDALALTRDEFAGGSIHP